jgi:hypothetical protein
MKFKQLFLVLILIIGMAILGYFLYPKQKPIAPHYHAGFYLYINGVLQDFTDIQYMHTTFCELDNVQKNSSPLPEEKAHLHDGVGDVVHVHSKDVKWIDLFDSFGYRFPFNKTVVGYKDGHEVKDIMNQVIIPQESVIIAVGDTKNIDIKRYVPLSHIKDVESKSESCGKQ